MSITTVMKKLGSDWPEYTHKDLLNKLHYFGFQDFENGKMEKITYKKFVR